jgi:hypothetical protein
MVKMFFEPFNAVDTNDQYLQGILKLEEHWKTNLWASRAISTILGVIFVNSHLAMQILCENEASTIDTLKNDMDQLAYRLIFNPYLVDEQCELRPRPADPEAITTPDALIGSHVLANLSDSTKYRGKSSNSARLRCTICHVPTRSYCVDCSDDSRGKYVAVCRPGSKRKNVHYCYYEHKKCL